MLTWIVNLLSSHRSRRGAVIAAILTTVLCWSALLAQDPHGKDAQAGDAKGMNPRATPADYQAHALAGSITIAAEFAGHSIPTPQAVLSTEEYVVVEVGFFGPPEARATISSTDFSLRVNGKKTPLPVQPFALVFASLKDPEWTPPVPVESKSKTSIGSAGQGQNDPGATPAPVRVPFEVQRVMQQRVQKASLPEGDRLLPAAGLIFFKRGGKDSGISSVELIYAGPAGKATLTLHP